MHFCEEQVEKEPEETDSSLRQAAIVEAVVFIWITTAVGSRG